MRFYIQCRSKYPEVVRLPKADERKDIFLLFFDTSFEMNSAIKYVGNEHLTCDHKGQLVSTLLSAGLFTD